MTNQLSVVLALECSAGQASAAIGQDGQILAQTSIDAPHGHAAWMIPLAVEALEKSGKSFSDLTHILAGRGPGSFTGIRVALSGAKGLALSLGIKASGLSSLSSLAALVSTQDQAAARSVMSVIDTRRGSLFYQGFSPDGQPLAAIEDGSPDDVAAMLKASSDRWIIAGHLAQDIAALCGDTDLITSDLISPDAVGLILDFNRMMATGQIPDDHSLEPLYLAAPILGPRK